MYRNLSFKLLTSCHLIAFTESKTPACVKYTRASMTRNMDATRIPCPLLSDPEDVFVSRRFLTFLLSEKDRRYLFL
jgi:hypothetical protein